MTKVSAPALRVRQAQQTSPSQTASWGPDSCLSLSATTQWKTLVPKSVRKMAVPAMGTQASPGEDPGCTFQDRTTKQGFKEYSNYHTIALISHASKEKVKVAQSCPTLCDLIDFAVHGILQAGILEWVAFPFSSDLPNPGTEPRSPTL